MVARRAGAAATSLSALAWAPQQTRPGTAAMPVRPGRELRVSGCQPECGTAGASSLSLPRCLGVPSPE
eukprot:3911663-Rhodomonas_salina.1